MQLMCTSLFLQNGHLCKLHVPLWWVWGATGCICLQWEGWKLKVGQGRRQLRELKVESGCCCSKVKEHWSLSLPVCNISFASSQQGLSFHKKLKRAKMKWVGWGLGKGSEGGGRRQDSWLRVEKGRCLRTLVADLLCCYTSLHLPGNCKPCC